MGLTKEYDFLHAMSFPYYVPYASRSELSKRWNALKASKRIEQGVDADTLRFRALQDARGKLERSGTTYDATGAHTWKMRRSIAGRINQRDFTIDGNYLLTAGIRRIPLP